MQELQAWNTEVLLDHPTLRRTYRQSLTMLAQPTPPWTAVLTRLQIKEQRSVPGIGGWRGLQLLVLNVSGVMLTAASAHFTAAECEVKRGDSVGGAQSLSPQVQVLSSGSSKAGTRANRWTRQAGRFPAGTERR